MSVVERDEGSHRRSDAVEIEDGGGRGGGRQCGAGERGLVDGADIVVQRLSGRGGRKLLLLFLDGP